MTDPSARSTTDVVPQAPDPPVSAKITASPDPSPVTSAIWAVRFCTGARPVGYARPQTGRHGAPPSSNRRHAAIPRSVRNGSPPGISQLTRMASPADVVARHEPVTCASRGTSAAAGTSPGPTGAPDDGSSPAGSPLGYGEGGSVPEGDEEALDPLHAAARITNAARKGRRIGAMVAVRGASEGERQENAGRGRVPGGTA